MRLQPPDQLSTVLMWVSALFMAIKGGVEAWPAASRALPQMSAGWLSFVPLALLLIAAIRSIGKATAPVAVNAPVPLAAPAPAKGAAKTDVRDRQAMISGIDYARQWAAVGARNRTAREAEKDWPRMLAALLSAQKEFGMPMPPIGRGAILNVECGKRFLEQIVPLLQAGHDEEARQAGQAFIDRLTPQ